MNGHIRDEQLVSCLDGELDPVEDAQVRAHLKDCWQCRGRALTFEEQIKRLANAHAAQQYPSQAGIHSSREQCLAIIRAMDRASGLQGTATPDVKRFTWIAADSDRAREAQGERVDTAPKTSPLAAYLTSAWTAAAVLVAAAAFLFIGTPEANQKQPAIRAIKELRDADAILERKPVHQEFRIELTEIRPAMRKREGRIELWSEPAQQRRAVQWIEGGAMVRKAVWAEGARAPSPSQVVELADLNSGDLKRLEEGFMKWVQSRQWRPISFSSDLASFAGRDGVDLTMERLSVAKGAATLRLTAGKHGKAGLIEIVVEVDAVTQRPQLQRLRIETSTAEVELRLTTEQIEISNPSTWEHSLFRPADEDEIPNIRQVRVAELVEAPVLPAPVLPTPAEVASLELRALYALHESKACLGEPVEVTVADHRIRIQGLVETGSRRAAILNHLDWTAGAPAVLVEIRTVEEQTGTRAARIKPDLDEISESADGIKPEDLIPILSSRVTLVSEEMMRHGWALRKLANRYAADSELVTRGEPGELLNRMVDDHLHHLRNRIEQQRRILAPLAAALGASPVDPLSEAKNRHASLGWRDIHQLFGRLQDADTVAHQIPTGPERRAEAVRQLMLELPDIPAGFGETKSEQFKVTRGDQQ